MKGEPVLEEAGVVSSNTDTQSVSGQPVLEEAGVVSSNTDRTMVTEAPLAVQRFTACVGVINDWMSASRLKLNPTKMEVL